MQLLVQYIPVVLIYCCHLKLINFGVVQTFKQLNQIILLLSLLLSFIIIIIICLVYYAMILIVYLLNQIGWTVDGQARQVVSSVSRDGEVVAIGGGRRIEIIGAISWILSLFSH